MIKFFKISNKLKFILAFVAFLFGASTFAQLNSDQFLFSKPEFHSSNAQPLKREIASSKKASKKNIVKVKENIPENQFIEIPQTSEKPTELNKFASTNEIAIDEDKISVDLYCGIGLLNSKSDDVINGAYSSDNADCGVRTQLLYDNDWALQVGYLSKFNMKISEAEPAEKKINANDETLEISLKMRSLNKVNYFLGYYYESLMFPMSVIGRAGQLIKGLGLGVQKEIFNNLDQKLNINFFVIPILSHNQSSGSSAISIGSPSNGQLFKVDLEGSIKIRKKEYLLIEVGYKNLNLPADQIQQTISETALDFGYRFSY